jgi:hypothetical protein
VSAGKRSGEDGGGGEEESFPFPGRLRGSALNPISSLSGIDTIAGR